MPCCGFDSIPSDMGTFLVASHIHDKLHRCAEALWQTLNTYIL